MDSQSKHKRININHASCIDWLAAYDGPLFDSCVTDPPYELGFMGKAWDSTGVAFDPATWLAVYEALKPGAYLVAFSGTRTYHRMACAIEDAGFEIRDQLMWTYGSGFPKSHNISKSIDKAAGAEREIISTATDRRADGTLYSFNHNGNITSNEAATPEAEKWQGWGTALKPALEPICLARKPLSEKTVAANVLKHGTGAINIDGCRVDAPDGVPVFDKTNRRAGTSFDIGSNRTGETTGKGRWPANLIHDGSDEVLAGFPDTSSGSMAAGTIRKNQTGFSGNMPLITANDTPADCGSAARFFYSAKAGPLDRIGTAHATVKPVDVMRWLCRLITPPGGLILEPFAGSGTTGIAAMAEGFNCQMIELDSDHVIDIERKLAFLRGDGALTFQEHNHAKAKRSTPEPLGGLFG